MRQAVLADEGEFVSAQLKFQLAGFAGGEGDAAEIDQVVQGDGGGSLQVAEVDLDDFIARCAAGVGQGDTGA